MLKFGVVLFVLLAVLPSAPLAADEVERKPESEQAVLQFLKKCREAMGDLHRFEIECLQSQVDSAFGTDERSRVRLYCEQPAGYIFERRAIDPCFMQTSRQTGSGELFRVKSGRPDTWLMVGDRVTNLNYEHRTFENAKVEPNDWLFGPLCYHLPHEFIPPWFDPAVDWNMLQSQLRVESAQSTTGELSIKFEPRDKHRAWQYRDDERLLVKQAITVDRKTLQPRKWCRANPQGTMEYILVYQRLDLNPPQRELKVDLTGYQDASAIRRRAPQAEPKSALKMQTLELGARILWCLLF
ncbi:MAG TPA: hypothetical protein VFG04_23590 [Planctomycetaceae bacterium]|jgi:hypothetical protein|nr:hypothetical protein [Planctomycetaceae bacterium]